MRTTWYLPRRFNRLFPTPRRMKRLLRGATRATLKVRLFLREFEKAATEITDPERLLRGAK